VQDKAQGLGFGFESLPAGKTLADLRLMDQQYFYLEVPGLGGHGVNRSEPKRDGWGGRGAVSADICEFGHAGSSTVCHAAPACLCSSAGGVLCASRVPLLAVC
jgi:hypothetical protein